MTVECAYGTEGRGFESLQPHDCDVARIADKRTPGVYFSFSLARRLLVVRVIDLYVVEGHFFFVINADVIVDNVETIMLRALVITNAYVRESPLCIATSTLNLSALNVGLTGHTGGHVQNLEIAASWARTTVERDQVRKCEQLLISLRAREVMAVHLSTNHCRAVSTAVATLFVVSLSLAGCSVVGAKSACATGSGASRLNTSSGSLGLTPAKGVSSTTLPPSHDNDAGRGRIPDSHPDADVDANQRPPICPRPS